MIGNFPSMDGPPPPYDFSLNDPSFNEFFFVDGENEPPKTGTDGALRVVTKDSKKEDPEGPPTPSFAENLANFVSWGGWAFSAAMDGTQGVVKTVTTEAGKLPKYGKTFKDAATTAADVTSAVIQGRPIPLQNFWNLQCGLPQQHLLEAAQHTVDNTTRVSDLDNSERGLRTAKEKARLSYQNLIETWQSGKLGELLQKLLGSLPEGALPSLVPNAQMIAQIRKDCSFDKALEAQKVRGDGEPDDQNDSQVKRDEKKAELSDPSGNNKKKKRKKKQKGGDNPTPVIEKTPDFKPEQLLGQLDQLLQELKGISPRSFQGDAKTVEAAQKTFDVFKGMLQVTVQELRDRKVDVPDKLRNLQDLRSDLNAVESGLGASLKLSQVAAGTLLRLDYLRSPGFDRVLPSTVLMKTGESTFSEVDTPLTKEVITSNLEHVQAALGDFILSPEDEMACEEMAARARSIQRMATLRILLSHLAKIQVLTAPLPETMDACMADFEGSLQPVVERLALLQQLSAQQAPSHSSKGGTMPQLLLQTSMEASRFRGALSEFCEQLWELCIIQQNVEEQQKIQAAMDLQRQQLLELQKQQKGIH